MFLFFDFSPLCVCCGQWPTKHVQPYKTRTRKNKTTVFPRPWMKGIHTVVHDAIDCLWSHWCRYPVSCSIFCQVGESKTSVHLGISCGWDSSLSNKAEWWAIISLSQFQWGPHFFQNRCVGQADCHKFKWGSSRPLSFQSSVVAGNQLVTILIAVGAPPRLLIIFSVTNNARTWTLVANSVTCGGHLSAPHNDLAGRTSWSPQSISCEGHRIGSSQQNRDGCLSHRINGWASAPPHSNLVRGEHAA